MQKIKKFKRMIRNEERLNKQATNTIKRPDTLFRENFLNVHDYRDSKVSLMTDDFDSVTENGEPKDPKEESVSSGLNKKIEQERQQKIAISMIAHNLPKFKEPLNVLPYLYQKDILEGASPPSHYVSTTRAMVFRMNNVNPQRFNTKVKEKSVNREKILLSLIKPYTSAAKRPKLGGDQNPAYMKPTTASKMSRWDAEAPNEEIEEPKSNLKPREDSKVMSPTYAYMQKVSRIYTKKENTDKPI